MDARKKAEGRFSADGITVSSPAKPAGESAAESKAVKARWTGFPGEGMWSPSEQAGWWLTFGERSSSRAQAYGPFPAESDARGYLAWVRTEATVNRHGHPAIVVALKAAGSVRIVEILEAL